MTEEQKLALTQERVGELARQRVEKIAKEFTEGFQFIGEHDKSVTFFGSSMMDQNDPYCDSARKLAGRIVSELGYSVLTGGGPGIMEAANRGAKEAGGNSLALTIRLPHPQIVNEYITKQVDPDYFFVRKVCLSFAAEALIFFPGGLGTLDEFFELMTLTQTRKLVGTPLICVGVEFWKNVENLLNDVLVKRNLILPGDTKLFHMTDNHDEVLDLIRKSPVRVVEEIQTGATVPVATQFRPA